MRTLDGQIVLLDRAQEVIHQLNETASFIWSRCNGDLSLAEIAEELRVAFDVESETARRDVLTTVTQFGALKLLETNPRR